MKAVLQNLWKYTSSKLYMKSQKFSKKIKRTQIRLISDTDKLNIYCLGLMDRIQICNDIQGVLFITAALVMHSFLEDLADAKLISKYAS